MNPEDQGNEPPSLSQTLESALDKFNPEPTPPAGGTTGSGTDAAAPPSSRSPQPTKEAPAAGETGPQRDAQGRFIPKGQPDPNAAPAPAAGAAAQPAPAAGAAAPDPLAAAPASWPKEMAPTWDKVPGEVRGYLHQREAELQRGFQSVAARGNIAEAILGEFVPYAEALQQENATPMAAIRALLQTANALRTGGNEYKKAILHSLAQQYNVDFSNGLQVDPRMAQVEAQNMQLQNERMYGNASQMQQVAKQVENYFYQFAQDPANEFFPHVRGIMGNLIGTGVANDLQAAYQMALGMHPEVRNELFKRQAAANANEQRRNDAAGMSVTGSPGGRSAASAADSAKDLRGFIEAAFDGSGGRA
jgi:hypothetical protein